MEASNIYRLTMVDNTGYQHWHEQELDEDSRKRACDEEEDSARRVYDWPIWRNNSARSGAPDGASAGAGMDRSPATPTIPTCGSVATRSKYADGMGRAAQGSRSKYRGKLWLPESDTEVGPSFAACVS